MLLTLNIQIISWIIYSYNSEMSFVMGYSIIYFILTGIFMVNMKSKGQKRV